MLWLIVGVLLLLWAVGFVLDVVGAFIHLLLVLVIVLALVTLFRGIGPRSREGRTGP